MRWFLWMTFLLVVCNVATADTVVVVNNGTSAQQEAETMARTGVMRHCGRSGGRREGIGFSTVSAQQAIESCCYYRDAQRGRYRIVERGVAKGPRGWFACLRFE